MEFQIEAVARALHAAEENALIWDRECEIVKEDFRDLARIALAMLAEHRGQERSDLQAFAFPYAA